MYMILEVTHVQKNEKYDWRHTYIKGYIGIYDN